MGNLEIRHRQALIDADFFELAADARGQTQTFYSADLAE